MRPEAVEQARERLARAKAAAGRLSDARDFDSMQSAWVDFLMAASGFYSKLEQGAKSNGKSVAWYGRKKHERKSDDLLNYLHRARSAEEHGIESVVTKAYGGVRVSGGGDYGINIKNNKLEIDRLAGPEPVVDYVDPKIRLVPVHDTRHGDITYLPEKHKGSPLPNIDPTTVANLCLSHLEVILSEADKLPKSV